MNELINGFAVALEPANIIAVFVGCLLGVVVGVLPGLGPVTTISVLLPFTYALDPTTAIILLAGIYAGTMYGGTVTSVLLRLPGESASVVTTIDGYEMAKQGRAGPALSIAAIGSFIGASVALVGLTFLAPSLSRVALLLGPPEYAALAVLGLVLVAYIATNSFKKSIVAASAGLFLATVGLDPISGAVRFTGGSPELTEGIGIVTVALGLFGIGEVLHNLSEPPDQEKPSLRIGKLLPSRTDFKRSRGAIGRGSIIGSLIGLVPGGGGVVSSLVSYGVERKVSKRPEEFGKGAIEGVAGPETANNASATSAFVPLLSLGIPFNVAISLVFSVLLINGITPGPRLITNEPDLFWGVVSSMYLGNVVLLILSLPLVGVFIQILRLKFHVLAPLIIAMSLVGVYTVDLSTFGMWSAICFGVIGYWMRKGGFSPGPLVLAFVLGAILENALRQSLILSDGSLGIFVTRPGAASILLVGALLIVSSVISFAKSRRLAKKTEHVDAEAPH